MRQQTIMREQDQQLDKVMNTVVNMKGIAQTMGTELQEQDG